MPQTLTLHLPAAPGPRLSAHARQVVANPEQYADRPLLRRMAWAVMMAGAGREVTPDLLARVPVELGDGG